MRRVWALALACCLIQAASLTTAARHPDLAGLLALKASICGSNCSALSSWRNTPAADVCESFDGVYCGVVAGLWRVVSIHLQLDKQDVSLNDSAMAAAGPNGTGTLHTLPHLRELELLCIQSKPPDPGPVPANLHSLTANLPDYPSQMVFADNSGISAVDSMLGSSSSSSVGGGLPARVLSSTPGSSSTSTSTSSSTSDDPVVAADGRDSWQQPPAPPLPPPAAAGDLPPRWFLAYPELRQLRVVACGATGQLPQELMHTPWLSSLVLSRNALTGTLPEHLRRLQRLTVLDLSGNALSGSLPSSWAGLPLLSYLYLQHNTLTGQLPCEWASLVSLKLADLSGNQWRAGPLSTCRESHASPGSPAGTSLSSSTRRAISSTSSSTGAALNRGSAAAPRCWLRRFCYDEGAFLCLQRRGGKDGGSAGCTSYVYGSSDLHIDPSNQCDHGGLHLAAIACLWLGLLTALLLIWLHHCRALRWAGQPAEALAAAWQQQQQFQQRQWLFTGPGGSPRTPGATAAAATGGGLAGGGGGGGRLRVPPDQTLPLLAPLYRAAVNSEEGAGYERPASPHAGLMDRGMSSGLPSALTTPPAATIVRILRRPSNLAGAYGDGPGSSMDAAAGPSEQLQYQASGEGPGGPSRQGRSGGSSRADGAGGQALRPASPGLGADGRGGEVASCFNPALLLPLAFLLLDVGTDLRVLLLWGVGPPARVKLWPSYALAGLMAVPHLLVGAVVHVRLLAAACLPPALKAASPGLVTDRLPPGSALIIRLYSALFASPCWLAYPLILVLLVPGVLLLSVLSPLTLLTHGLGLASQDALVSYVQLLQGCAALTESPGVAGLLTVLFLMGNSPLEAAYLDGSLFYLVLLSSFADMACAWHIRLQGTRRRRLLELDLPPAGRWS